MRLPGMCWAVVLGLLGLPGSARAASAAKEACALLTRPDAEAALGEPVAEAQGQIVSKGGGNSAAVSTCQFRAAAAGSTKSVSLMARYSKTSSDRTMASVRKTLRKARVSVREIPGVGDRALWGFMKPGRTTSGQLNVVRNGTAYLMVTINGAGSERAALDKAKTVALQALARI